MDINTQNIMNQSLSAIAQNKTDSVMGSAKAPQNIDQIEATAKEMESVFMGQMLSHMFASIETDDTFGGGQAEDIYRGMMVQEYGKIITEAGGIGMSDSIKAEMINLQQGGTE